ncbi:MAG TPA: glycosyltransferase [Chthoniobacterales bacterium]|jgi:glycosyltransferase involved in cell wall biosynthesis
MSTPVLSVIIPVYNVGTYLEGALLSVRNQTFSDFECIVVNDGSTDDTAQVLERVAAADPRMKVLTQKNSGLVASLKNAIAAARGEFLARMDGDDFCTPDRFAKQVEFLRAHPEVVCVGACVDMLDPRGRRLKTYRPPEKHAAILAELLAGNGGALIHPTVTCRKAAVDQIGGYSTAFAGYGEDWDLFLRLSKLGRLHNLPEVLLKYRQHAKSYNQTRSAAQIERLSSAVRDARLAHGLEPLASIGSVNDQDSVFRQWALWALEGNEPRTAVLHAAAGVLRAPLEYRSWSLFQYVVRQGLRA